MIVLDTSAVIAILAQEPEAGSFALAIERASGCLISAATVVEPGLVVTVRYGEPGGVELDELLRGAEVETVPVTVAHAQLAREAFLRYGRGRHPARLNFGDCFSYALAKATGLPLLFKGDDFSQTDLQPALTAPS